MPTRYTKKGDKRPAIEVARSRVRVLTGGYQRLLVKQEKERLAYQKKLKIAESTYEYYQQLEKLETEEK